jgi:hypothetical protein
MIKARMYCQEILVTTGQEKVELRAVYSNNPESPNHKWAVASPQGSLMLVIANPAARGHFKPGQEYEITIEEAVPFPSV